jgi:hypothetical protein
MACDNDARLALTTYSPFPANRLVSPIGTLRPRGLRACSRSETSFCVGFVTTAVQLTFISLIDRAALEFVDTVPWLTDPTIVIYVSRLPSINHPSLMSKQGRHCASTRLWYPVLTVRLHTPR